MRYRVEPSGVTLRNESLHFFRDTFETEGVLGGRIVTVQALASAKLFSQLSLFEPPCHSQQQYDVRDAKF
jgi:hypothetical protein